MNILFARPASGGSAAETYTNAMVRALVALNHDAAVIPMEGAFPQADVPALDAAARVVDAATRAHASLVIDGAALPAFGAHAQALGALRATVLTQDGALGPHAATLRIVAVSEAARDALVAAGTAAAIRVIGPGHARHARARGSGGTGCHVLAVGPLTPALGHDELIAALARLTDLDWRLTIAGDAPDPACAAALRAQDAGVRVVVNPDLAALESLWSTADLFALARPAAGNAAIMEALARGLPVCAGDGAAADVPAGAGVLAPEGDRDQLSKAIRRLVFSAALRESYGDAAVAASAALPDWSSQAALFAAAIA